MPNAVSSLSSSLARRVRSVEERSRSPIIGSVRILVGLMWLANLHWKVPPDFGEPTNSGLYKFFDSVTRNSPFAPFTWFTENVILPNFTVFGWLTLIAETVVATLLIIGYRTKLAALGGALITVPILLAVIYYDRADEWSWAYYLMIGIHLLLLASDAGRHVGLDGVLERSPADAQRRLLPVGVVAIVIGAAGLFVARSISFIGADAALLGSDAGFTDADGRLVRRWELKFLWFNPFWALLTIAGGVLLVIGARRVWAAWAGGAGFAVLAVAVFATRTFDYQRDDGVTQVVSTASNAAVWAGLAIVGLLVARRATTPAPASHVAANGAEPG